MQVAAPAASALRDDEALVDRREVDDQLARLRVEDLRARRDAQLEVDAAAAVHIAATPVLAALRVDLAPVAQVEERRQAGVRDEDDVPAAPAIAARRTAKGDVTLASKCHGSVAAIARVDLYQDFVDELHGALMTRLRPRRTRSPYTHGGKEGGAVNLDYTAPRYERWHPQGHCARNRACALRRGPGSEGDGTEGRRRAALRCAGLGPTARGDAAEAPRALRLGPGLPHRAARRRAPRLHPAHRRVARREARADDGRPRRARLARGDAADARRFLVRRSPRVRAAAAHAPPGADDRWALSLVAARGGR